MKKGGSNDKFINGRLEKYSNIEILEENGSSYSVYSIVK
jgi:hypothetical protein